MTVSISRIPSVTVDFSFLQHFPHVFHNEIRILLLENDHRICGDSDPRPRAVTSYFRSREQSTVASTAIDYKFHTIRSTYF